MKRNNVKKVLKQMKTRTFVQKEHKNIPTDVVNLLYNQACFAVKKLGERSTVDELIEAFYTMASVSYILGQNVKVAERIENSQGLKLVKC